MAADLARPAEGPAGADAVLAVGLKLALKLAKVVHVVCHSPSPSRLRMVFTNICRAVPGSPIAVAIAT